MTWFFIVISSSFLWSLVNISDKYLVNKYSTEENGSGSLVIFSSLVGIFVSIGILIFTNGIFDISLLDKILLLICGGLTIFWFILYLYVLEKEEISTVAPWFLTSPIFGYILGYLFLGEQLVPQQIFGSIIVLFGIFLISIDFSKRNIKIKKKIAVYMLCVSAIIAIMGVIFKYVTVKGNFWVSSFWEYTGLGIVGILIFTFIPKYRKDFINMNKTGGVKIFLLNSISETATITGNLLTNFALLLAPVAMVYLVGSFQPAILLLLTILGTKFFPKIISENMERKIILPKIIAIVIIIIGSSLLFN